MRSIFNACLSSLLVLGLVLGLIACGGGGGSGGGGPAGGDYGEVSLGPGVVGDLESDGRLAYLGTRGLFSPVGVLRALDSGGGEVWSLFAPDNIIDVMVGGDGLIYVGTSQGTLAATADGEWTAFDGARGGALGWHPWGLPMATAPAGGIAVMDPRGDLLLEAYTDWVVGAMAGAPDGAVYAFISPNQRNPDPNSYVLKLNDRFEPIWNVPLALGGSPGRVELAVSPEGVVAGFGGYVQAWDHDGAVRWAVEGVSGHLLIDTEGTTYISGGRLTAVSATGEILWDRAGPGFMTLTGAGAVAMVAEADGSLRQTRIDLATGESLGGPLWTPMTAVAAPVVVGQRTVAAAHQITGNSWFPEGGGIVVEQGSETFVDIAGYGGDASAPWPGGDGPGGRRALPVEPVQPTEADLYGLWVAQEGPRARAIHLTDEAWNFGLSETRAYGIFDYDVRQPPRLVEVGTWSYDGAQLRFEPQDQVAGVALKGAVEVYAANPGTLRVDDPAQDSVRTFRRARRLPAADALVAGADTLGWLFGEGARDGDTGVALVGEGDRATVVSAFDYIGRLGGETYVVERRADGVDGQGDDRSDNLIFDVTADGSLPHVVHNQAPGIGRIGDLARVDGAVRAYGPFTIGDDPSLVFSAQLDPAGSTFDLADQRPWRGPDLSDGTTAVSDPVLWAGGALYTGWTGASPDSSGEGLVLRVDADGEVVWQRQLGGPNTAVRAAVGLASGEVVIVGELNGELALGERVLRAVGGTYIARLDGETGEPIDGYRIAGRLGTAELAELADGGVVLGAMPRTPYNAGTGGVFAARDYTPLVFSAFGPDLSPRWTRRFDPDPTAGIGVSLGALEVDPFGNITAGGRLAGDYRYEGVPAGRGDRTTGLWQFDACGALLWQRRFNTFVSVADVDFGGDGTVYATGGFLADLWVPPWVAIFSGGFPDVAAGFDGGTDTLVFTVEGAKDRLGVDQPECRSPPPTRSLIKIDPRGLGAGRVVSDPPGIDCPGACEAEFVDLTEVRLSAIADDGSSFDAFTGAGCAGQTCDLLVAFDSVIEAWFEPTAVDWVVPMPGTDPSSTELAARGDEVVVGVQLRNPTFTLGDRMYAPTSGYGVVRVGPEGQAELQEVPGAAGVNLVGGIDLAADGAVAIGGAGSLVPEGGTNAGLVVLEADGSVRWSRPLQTSRNSALVVPAFGEDRVATLLPADGTITIDETTVDAPFGAVAVFDADDGALLGLLGFNAQAEHIFWAEDGTLVVWSDRPLFGDIVPELPYDPEQAGRWFMRLDADLELVELVGWRFNLRMPLTMRSVDGATPLYGWTEALRPAWAGSPGGDPTWPHPLRPAPDGWLVGNATADAARLPGRTGVGVRLSVVKLDRSGRARSAWATRSGDDVVVHALGAADGRVHIIASAATLRDPAGEPIAGPDGGVAIVGLRMPEVPRD